MKENSVLVIGKSGQIAKSLAKYKSNANFDLVFLDRNQINLNLDFYKELSNFIVQNNPQFIVNAAAYTAVDKAENDKDKAMRINGYAVGLIAKLCSEHKIPLLQYSTDYVFGDNGSNFLTPEYKKKPCCIYGQSKLLGENLINKFVRLKNLKVIILRISWVFSANSNNFVNTILNLSRNKDLIKIINDQIGGPTSSDSIALATLKIINSFLEIKPDYNNHFPWGEYHFQGTPVVSWFQFACSIVEEAYKLGLIEKKPEISAISTEEYKSQTKRPLNSRLSMQSANEYLKISSPSWKRDLIKCLDNIKTLKVNV